MRILTMRITNRKIASGALVAGLLAAFLALSFPVVNASPESVLQSALQQIAAETGTTNGREWIHKTAIDALAGAARIRQENAHANEAIWWSITFTFAAETTALLLIFGGRFDRDEARSADNSDA